MIHLSVSRCIAVFWKQSCNSEVTKESLLTSLMTQLLQNGKSILHRRSCSICKLKSDFSFDGQMHGRSIYRLCDRRVRVGSAANRKILYSKARKFISTNINWLLKQIYRLFSSLYFYRHWFPIYRFTRITRKLGLLISAFSIYVSAKG